MDRKTVPRHPESHGGGRSTIVPVMSLMSSQGTANDQVRLVPAKIPRLVGHQE